MFRFLNEMGPRCFCSLSQFLDTQKRREIYSSLADAEEYFKVMHRNIKLTTAIEIQSSYQYN